MSRTLLQYILDKKHHAFRRPLPELEHLGEDFSRLGLEPKERMARRFELLMQAQTPVLLPDEKICFVRTTTTLPDCFTEQEWCDIKSKHYIHELGYLSNLSPDYETVLASGLLALYDGADPYGKRAIDAILALADRYKAEAERRGNTELAAVLTRVPRYGATNFYEALQFFRILHFSPVPHPASSSG